VQQEHLVLTREHGFVVLEFLVGRNRAGNNAAEFGAVACRLVHPAHEADREAGIDAQPAGGCSGIANFERPEFDRILSWHRHGPATVEAGLGNTPFDVGLADRKYEHTGRPADRFVGNGKHCARILVLDVDKPAGVMGVVLVLRQHEGLLLQHWSARILAGFRLHVLCDRVATAIQLQQQAWVPKKRARLRHHHRAVQFESLAVLARPEKHHRGSGRQVQFESFAADCQ
jgi:hypothetical protein